MCRFIAFKGRNAILLKKLLKDPSNSLISQSRLAKETKTGLNADGFGIGWYDQRIDTCPGLFKSIQPAWNDENLISISSKILSDCFIGHVRAATIGDVTTANCHPFSYKEFLFAHNGTIDNFEKIKKDFIQLLDESVFHLIKGQTDSEHFFMLVCSIINQSSEPSTAKTMSEALCKAIQQLNTLFHKKKLKPQYRINAVLTNGKELVTIRLNSNKNKSPISLYYALIPADHIHSKPHEELIIASERLSSVQGVWEEMPRNSILMADKDLHISFMDLSKTVLQPL